MFKKINLFCQIRKFYSIYGSEVGGNFIKHLSDMTADNVHDVLFDLNEVLDTYEYRCYEEDEMYIWLGKLRKQIITFRERNTVAITVLVIAVVALAIVGGYHMGRYNTIRQAELLDINESEYHINFGDEVHTYTFEEGI